MEPAENNFHAHTPWPVSSLETDSEAVAGAEQSANTTGFTQSIVLGRGQLEEIKKEFTLGTLYVCTVILWHLQETSDYE